MSLQVSVHELAMLAHDMRTPLAGILGTLELLSMVDRGDPALQEGLARMRVCGEYQLRLIQDILDLARTDAGHPGRNMRLEYWNLPELIKGISDMFEPDAHVNQVRLETKLDLKAPRLVHIDANKLKRVLGNLVSNAVRHARSGAVSLTVERESEQAGDDSAGSQAMVRFSVLDTGAGVAPGEISGLLAPRSVHAGLTPYQPPAEGRYGIGLASTRELLNLMGSELRIDSTVGKGTCMSFRLRMRERVSL